MNRNKDGYVWLFMTCGNLSTVARPMILIHDGRSLPQTVSLCRALVGRLVQEMKSYQGLMG